MATEEDRPGAFSMTPRFTQNAPASTSSAGGTNGGMTTSQRNMLQRLNSQDSMEVAIMLSEQDSRFGTNMHDSLTAADEPEIQKLTRNGFTEEGALLEIFNRKFIPGHVPRDFMEPPVPSPRSAAPQRSHTVPRKYSRERAFHHLSDYDAMQLTYLLSDQEREFGTNMYDALTWEDEGEVDALVHSGRFSVDQAIQFIFERNYPSRHGGNGHHLHKVASQYPAPRREVPPVYPPAYREPPPGYYDDRDRGRYDDRYRDEFRDFPRPSPRGEFRDRDPRGGYDYPPPRDSRDSRDPYYPPPRGGDPRGATRHESFYSASPRGGGGFDYPPPAARPVPVPSIINIQRQQLEELRNTRNNPPSNYPPEDRGRPYPEDRGRPYPDNRGRPFPPDDRGRPYPPEDYGRNYPPEERFRDYPPEDRSRNYPPNDRLRDDRSYSEPANFDTGFPRNYPPQHSRSSQDLLRRGNGGGSVHGGSVNGDAPNDRSSSPTPSYTSASGVRRGSGPDRNSPAGSTSSGTHKLEKKKSIFSFLGAGEGASGTSGGSPMGNGSTHGSNSNASKSMTYKEKDVKQVMSYGFGRELAVAALIENNNDVKLAIQMLAEH